MALLTASQSPEIVDALNQPPGAVTYYGPELDIWCIALTVMSLLLAVRFPLGPTHTSVPAMRERVREALIQLDRLYPREMIVGHDRDEWERVRCALRDFLEIDAKRRMTAFKKYDVGAEIKAKVKEGKRLIADRKCESCCVATGFADFSSQKHDIRPHRSQVHSTPVSCGPRRTRPGRADNHLS